MWDRRHFPAGEPTAQQLSTLPVRCHEPKAFSPTMAQRSRVYRVEDADGLAILWRQSFRAFAGERPRSLRSHGALCQDLHTTQWPACQGVPGAAPRRGRASQQPSDGFNELQLVMMPCAFTDGGRNHKGALWDATRVLNAQHRRATPAFARAPLHRYPIAAVGLTPYGHLHDSHFYASTAPWILQLLELLPPPVPIVVSLSPRLTALYRRLAVPMERLHVLPAGGALYGAYTDWLHEPCTHNCSTRRVPCANGCVHGRMHPVHARLHAPQHTPSGGAIYAERLLSLVTTPLGKPQLPTVSPCFSSLDCIPTPLLTRCSRAARRVRAQPRPVAFRPAAATADTARARGAAFPRRHGAEALALQRGRAGAGAAQ